MGWDSAFMAVKSKARAKRGTLPFVAPELHYATKADIADVRTDVAKLETKIIDVKSDMIKWMVGIAIGIVALNYAGLGLVVALLK